MFDQAQYDNDLNAMFSDWDTATYTPSIYAHPSGNTITINGIFHYDFIDIDGVISNRPTFRTQTSLIPNPSNNDRLTLTNVKLDQDLNSSEFIVREYERWGNGETLLIMAAYDPR